MKVDLKNYYDKMLKESRNPEHKLYYYNRLHGNEIDEDKNKTQKVYSKKLDMQFQTMVEASRFIGKSDTYVYMILKNNLPNYYGFEKV
jgi:hypothetical protein